MGLEEIILIPPREPIDFKKMEVCELKRFADENKIDLKGYKKKDDIITAIQRHLDWEDICSIL